MKRRTLLRGAAIGAAATTTAVIAGNAMAEDSYQVAVTEQSSNRILLFGKGDDWTQDSIQWKWEPPSADSWTNLDDVKFRNTTSFGRVMLVTSSYGQAGLIDPDGKTLWSEKTGGSPHAIERIPHIAVVVVASSKGYLTVYGPTKTSDPGTLAKVQTVDLPGAHGVLWDPDSELLWTVGDNIVRAYQVSGSGRDTRLKTTDKTVKLPGGGHDLQPDYTDKGKLLVTDTHGAYEIDKAALTAKTLREESRLKSFARHTDGDYIWVRGENKEPRKWASPTVHFDSGDKTLADGQIYKARIVTPAFQ